MTAGAGGGVKGLVSFIQPQKRSDFLLLKSIIEIMNRKEHLTTVPCPLFWAVPGDYRKRVKGKKKYILHNFVSGAKAELVPVPVPACRAGGG